MTAKTSTNVQALYAHIHRLLDEHVSLHLTTYYVDCTQFRVYQVSIASVTVVVTDCLPTSRHSVVVCCQSPWTTLILWYSLLIHWSISSRNTAKINRRTCARGLGQSRRHKSSSIILSRQHRPRGSSLANFRILSAAVCSDNQPDFHMRH